jgi:hypothetical protein
MSMGFPSLSSTAAPLVIASHKGTIESLECYARGANGEAPFDRLLPGAVTSWLDADTTSDATLARLGLAVIRGLLLDLVATGDERSTHEAFRRYLQLVHAEQPT